LQAQFAEKLKEEQDPLKLQVMQERFLSLRAMEKEILKKHRTVVFSSRKYNGN